MEQKNSKESSHPDKKEGKIELVPIRSRPSSPIGGEELTPSTSDDSAVSKVDTLPLYTASAPLPESSLDTGVDEQPRLQNAGDQDNFTDKIETSSKKTSVYHFYHSGNRTENYEIHTISDKEAPLPQAHDPSAPYYVDDEKFREWRPSLLKRMLSLGRVEKEPAQRTIKRSIMIRNPKLDSRTATAPYFIHHPRIRDRRLPYTLRKGGSKNGPTICLFKGCWLWYHYKIVFDDRLADEGVIDGRGVVSARYGSKTGKNGTLKGHRFLMQRHPFDTGKEWHKREKARRKEDKARTKAEKKLDFATPIKAEEIVFMRWTSILSLHPREYHFHWSGVDFYWKGTATVADEKLIGFTMGYCHLKLVSVAPTGPSASTSKGKREKVKGHEVCLAKYTCTLAERKAGRLEVFDKTVTDFVDAYILPTAYQDVCDKEKGGEAEREAIALKKHARMEHLIMVTLNCMIQSESEKREAILELLLTAADAASNA